MDLPCFVLTSATSYTVMYAACLLSRGTQKTMRHPLTTYALLQNSHLMHLEEKGRLFSLSEEIFPGSVVTKLWSGGKQRKTPTE